MDELNEIEIAGLDESDTTPIVDEDAWLPEEEENSEPEKQIAEPEKEAEKPTVDAPAAIEPDAPKKLKFKAKLLDGESDIELDEAELPAVYQKAQNHDRIQAQKAELIKQREADAVRIGRLEALAKSKGFESVEKMLDTEESLDIRAEAEKLFPDNPEAGERLLRLERKLAEKPAEPAAVQTEPQIDAPTTRDMAAEVTELRRRFPETLGVAKLPDEVVEAVNAGKVVADAYAEYKNKQTAAEISKRDAQIAELEKQLNILKQNEKNRSSAPVRGTQTPSKKPVDDLERGFDSDY